MWRVCYVADMCIHCYNSYSGSGDLNLYRSQYFRSMTCPFSIWSNVLEVIFSGLEVRNLSIFVFVFVYLTYEFIKTYYIQIIVIHTYNPIFTCNKCVKMSLFYLISVVVMSGYAFIQINWNRIQLIVKNSWFFFFCLNVL